MTPSSPLPWLIEFPLYNCYSVSNVLLTYICDIIAGCLITSIVVFPMGWDSPHIQKTCGIEAKSYNLGDCNFRWAYLLAGIACLDALILSALAFILATKHIKLQPEPLYASTLRKGNLLILY